MSGTVLPGVPEEITRWIIGHAPVGNPAAMRGIADALVRSADQLTSTLRRLEETVERDAASAIEGATGTAMRDALGQRIDHGYAQVEALRALAKLMHEAANAIELEQYTVRAIGIALLLTIACSVGTQTVTARLDADIAANQARRRTLTWLLQRATTFREAFPMLAPAVSGVLMGSISMGGATAAAQYAQILHGDRKPGRVTEMDWGKVCVAAAAGGVGGATGGILAPKLMPWLHRLTTTAGLPMPTALAVLSTGAISGAAGGLTGGLTALTLTDSDINGRNLAEMALMGIGGGVVGGLGAAVHAARGASVTHTPTTGEPAPRPSAEAVAPLGGSGHATGDSGRPGSASASPGDGGSGLAAGDSGRSRSESAPPGEAGPAPGSGDGHTPKPELSPEMTQLGREIAGEVARNPRLDDYAPDARAGALRFAAEHAADAPAGLGRFREISLSRWQQLADAEAHQMLAGLHGGTNTPPGTTPPPITPPPPGPTPSAPGHGPGWPAWNKVFEQFRTGALGTDSPVPTTATPGLAGTTAMPPPAASSGNNEPAAAQMALAGNVIHLGAVAGVEAGPAAGPALLPGPTMHAEAPPAGTGSPETHVAAARDLGRSGSGSVVTAHPAAAHGDSPPPAGPGPRGPARGGGLGELPPHNDTPFLLDLGFFDNSLPPSPETPGARSSLTSPRRDTPATPAATNPTPAANTTPHLASDTKGQPVQAVSAPNPHSAPPATTAQKPATGADLARTNAPHGDDGDHGARRSDNGAARRHDTSTPRNDNAAPRNPLVTNTSHDNANAPPVPSPSPQSHSGTAPANPPTSSAGDATPISATGVSAAAAVPAVVAMAAANDPVPQEGAPETSDPPNGVDFAAGHSSAAVRVPQTSSPGPGSVPDAPHANTEPNSPAPSEDALNASIPPMSVTGATTPAVQATAADLPVAGGLSGGDDELPKRPDEFPAPLPPDASPRHSAVFPAIPPGPDYPANNDHPAEWQYPSGSGYYLFPGAPKIQEGPPPNVIPVIQRHEDAVIPAQRDARPATYVPPNLADPLASRDHDDHDEETRQTPIPDVSPLPRHGAETGTHLPAIDDLPEEAPERLRYATHPDRETLGAPENSPLPPRLDPDDLAYIVEQGGVPWSGAVPGTRLAPQQPRTPIEQPLPIPMMQMGGDDKDRRFPRRRGRKSSESATPPPSESPSSAPRPIDPPTVQQSSPPSAPPIGEQVVVPTAGEDTGVPGAQIQGPSGNETPENPDEPAAPATISARELVVANPTFVKYVAGQTVNSAGSAGVAVALPLVMFDMTGSPLAAGLSTSALFIPKLFELPAGYIADFFDRRRTMLISQAVGLGAAATATGMILFDMPNLALGLTTATLIEATAATVHLRIFQTAVRDFLADGERERGNRLANVSGSLGNISGQLFGPMLLGVGNSMPFAANALSYGSFFAILRKMRDSFPARAPKAPESFLRAIGEGARALWQENFLRDYTAITVVNNAAWAILQVRTAFVLHEAGSPGWVIGAVSSASGVGAISSLFLPGWIDKVKIAALYPAVLAGTAGFYTLQALTDNPALIASGALGGSFIIQTMNNRISTYQMQVFHGDLMGRATSVKSLFQGLGPAAGGLVGGAVVGAYGGDAAAMTAATLTVATATGYGLLTVARRGRGLFGRLWRSTEAEPAQSISAETAGDGATAHLESETPAAEPAAVIENTAIQLSRVLRVLGDVSSPEPDYTDPRWDSDKNWKAVEASIGAQLRPIKTRDGILTYIAQTVRDKDDGVDTVVLIVDDGADAYGHIFTNVKGEVLVFDTLIDNPDNDVPRARSYYGDENGADTWQPNYDDVKKTFAAFYTYDNGTLTPLHQPRARYRHIRHPRKMRGHPD
ncbi:MFS transporter [Nocardia sp. NPDC049190]|uniref:MFS transporter n=1 Tax=Nocardia sp. NPDC049190 TaxID=3155650 RepID=UPI00340E7C7A